MVVMLRSEVNLYMGSAELPFGDLNPALELHLTMAKAACNC